MVMLQFGLDRQPHALTGLKVFDVGNNKQCHSLLQLPLCARRNVKSHRYFLSTEIDLKGDSTSEYQSGIELVGLNFY